MPTLLFDGDCGFCTSSARWLERHAPSIAIVQPWQRADLDRIGVSEQACRDAVQWVDEDRRSSGPVAFADYARTSTAGWRAIGRLVGTPIGLRLAWPVYRWIARNRGRMPGGAPECATASSAPADAGHRVGDL
jgi:predicted DCC family thiol-disulfide oxidoreductase YuxK